MIEIQGRSTMNNFSSGRKHDILIILFIRGFIYIEHNITGTEHNNIITERSRLTDNQHRKYYLQQAYIMDGKHLNITRVVLTYYKSIFYTWF